MYSFPVQMVEFSTKGMLPLLSSEAARAIMARLLEFYRQAGRMRLLAYCIYPKGARFIVKEGQGYDFSSALETLRCNSEQLLLAQLAKEAKPAEEIWRELYCQKMIRNWPALRQELDNMSNLPLHFGLAKHPSDYCFCKADMASGLDLDQLARDESFR